MELQPGMRVVYRRSFACIDSVVRTGNPTVYKIILEDAGETPVYCSADELLDVDSAFSVWTDISCLRLVGYLKDDSAEDGIVPVRVLAIHKNGAQVKAVPKEQELDTEPSVWAVEDVHGVRSEDVSADECDTTDTVDESEGRSSWTPLDCIGFPVPVASNDEAYTLIVGAKYYSKNKKKKAWYCQLANGQEMPFEIAKDAILSVELLT